MNSVVLQTDTAARFRGGGAAGGRIAARRAVGGAADGNRLWPGRQCLGRRRGRPHLRGQRPAGAQSDHCSRRRLGAGAAMCVAEWPPVAEKLAGAFWPGPLTLVLPRSPRIPADGHGGRPDGGSALAGASVDSGGHPRLWLSAGGAQRQSGQSSFSHHRRACAKAFDGKIPLIVDGGPAQVGIESSVLDLATAPPRLLRPGMIHAESLLAVMGGRELQTAAADRPDGGEDHPAQSGCCRENIIPQKPNWSSCRWRDEGDLARQLKRARISALARFTSWRTVRFRCAAILGAWRCCRATPEAFARALYAELHQCDEAGAGLIVVEAPPPQEPWRAIADRLSRAGAGSVKIDEKIEVGQTGGRPKDELMKRIGLICCLLGCALAAQAQTNKTQPSDPGAGDPDGDGAQSEFEIRALHRRCWIKLPLQARLREAYEPAFNVIGQGQLQRQSGADLQWATPARPSNVDDQNYQFGIGGANGGNALTPWGLQYSLDHHPGQVGLPDYQHQRPALAPFTQDTTTAGINLAQPLLKNFWIDASRADHSGRQENHPIR